MFEPKPGVTVGGIPHPVNPPIYNDIMWITLFTVMVLYLFWAHRKRNTLSTTALLFLGSWSVFWQETYSNWGGYLLYSPDLNLMPWGPSPWTSPNKPWFMLFSYPVFYTAVYVMLCALVRAIHRRVPSMNLYLLAMLIGSPLFYLWNFFIDASSVDSGIWTYVDVMGPYLITSSGGLEPLVWPMIPFALFGGFMLCTMLKTSPDGSPSLLSLAHPERYRAGWRRETVRALSSVVYWNVMYWFFMTLPINLGRVLFGGPSVLVP